MAHITASHDLDTATVARVARAAHAAISPGDSWFSLPLQAELYFLNAARAAMTSPQKVTKVAQAIHSAVFPGDMEWENIPASWEKSYMDMARAAIKAYATR